MFLPVFMSTFTSRELIKRTVNVLIFFTECQHQKNIRREPPNTCDIPSLCISTFPLSVLVPDLPSPHLARSVLTGLCELLLLPTVSQPAHRPLFPQGPIPAPPRAFGRMKRKDKRFLGVCQVSGSPLGPFPVPLATLRGLRKSLHRARRQSEWRDTPA